MKEPFFFSRIVIVFLAVVGLSACNPGNTPPPEEPDQYVVSVTKVASLTKQQVIAQLASYNALVASQVKYGVTMYSVVYKTKNADDTEIEASGALVVPTLATGDPAVALVSYQHGTITSDAQAPSYFGTSGDSQILAALASLGYVTVAPDYIGYGTSKNLAHTYEHRKGLSQASIDLLRATKEYLAKNNAGLWDNRVYLTGYSEGGYATMALYKKIQEEASSEFNLRAVSAGAGAYNKTAFMKYVVNEAGTTVAGYNQLYAWVLLTYNRFYGLNRPASYYFKEPYASRIPADVKHASDLSNLNISTNFGSVLTDSFKKSLNDGTDTQFINAVKDNDIYNWKPVTPLWMYHGNADVLVPFFNSQTAFDAMKAQGATKVQFFPLAGKDHSSGVQDFILGTFTMLLSVQ